MKKITIILFLMCISVTHAQFTGAGEYRLRSNFTTNGIVYLSHDGSKAVRETSSTPDATKFTFVSTGVAGQFNIVVNTNDGILRANSTSEIQVVSYTPGTPSTSNPNVWAVTATSSSGANGETTYNVTTPLTGSERFLVYANSTDAIGYSGSNFTRTQWIFESTTLSTNDFDTSSIFISNPVNSEIIIKGLDNKVNKIEVFDLVGKSVLEKDAKGASSLQIDTNALNSGLYLVKLYGETSTLTKKVIKR